MHDLFGRSRLPVDFSRKGRVALIGEFFEAMRDGREPSIEAKMFVVSGVLGWLESGGDLLGDYWKIRGEQGSTHTPSLIWRSLRDGSSGRGTADPETPNIGKS